MESSNAKVNELIKSIIYDSAEWMENNGYNDQYIVATLLHDLGDARVSECEHAEWCAKLVRPLLGDKIAGIHDCIIN